MVSTGSEQPIRELRGDGARVYIAERMCLTPEAVVTTDLGGGVSNNVVLVEAPGTRFVLKQSLPKLRVEEDWFSDRRRIFREALAFRELAPILPAGSIPEVLFEDRDEYAFAMSAAPEGAITWKEQLLDGTVSHSTAARVGEIHASLIGGTFESDHFAERFGDQTAFEQLRLDAYYEFTARRYPELSDWFERALARCREQRVCLVHGDWSPKNLMVSGADVMAIDFEVIHFGDPSFDVAFLMNHLLLKSFHRPRWRGGYRDAASRYWSVLASRLPGRARWLEEATLQHLPLLLLARMDGKSPAEYIREPELKQRIRGFARGLTKNVPATLDDVFARISE